MRVFCSDEATLGGSDSFSTELVAGNVLTGSLELSAFRKGQAMVFLTHHFYLTKLLIPEGQSSECVLSGVYVVPRAHQNW